MKTTPVLFSKGENPVLSNFYPSQIAFRSRVFACAEGAYQAFKSGVYYAGFEKLNGYAAKRRARELKIPRGANAIEVMREILEARAEQDPEFTLHLREAEGITHPVGDPFWREWFPRLLNQLRDKLRAEADLPRRR